MADRTARSLQRARGDADRRPHLTLIAGALDAQPEGAPASLAAPAVPPPLLSPASDICGISRFGWTAAALLYAAIAAAILLMPWRVRPPEPWPPSATVVTLVFEEPPAPPAPPPAAEPEPPPPVAEAPPPEPAAAEPAPEPAPPVAAAEPEPQPLPKPPPPKPAPPRHHASPPRTAAPAPRQPAPSRPAEPQVATTAVAPPALPAPILPPQPISAVVSNRKPDYPIAAKQRGQQGRVVLRVEVSAAGLPLKVAVLTTSGHALLDKAAVAAVEQWRFHPATQAGAPVAGTADVPIQFRLEE